MYGGVIHVRVWREKWKRKLCNYIIIYKEEETKKYFRLQKNKKGKEKHQY